MSSLLFSVKGQMALLGVTDVQGKNKRVMHLGLSVAASEGNREPCHVTQCSP